MGETHNNVMQSKGKMVTKRSTMEIFDNLPKEDRICFLAEVLDAIDKAMSRRSLAPIVCCIEEWEATAELNAIPGLRRRVWANYWNVRKRITRRQAHD